MSISCLICSSSIIQGQTRPRKYCSSACKQIGYRNTKKSKGFRLLHGRFIALDLSNVIEQVKVSSVGSTCNTHTKHRNPAVNCITEAVI